MEYEDLENVGRDYLTRPKQVCQSLTYDGFDDDDDDEISHAIVYIRLCCYITIQLSLRNVNVFSFYYEGT